MDCWLALPVHSIFCRFNIQRFDFDALFPLSTGLHRLGITVGNLMVIVYCMFSCSWIQILFSEIHLMFFHSCFEIYTSLSNVSECAILARNFIDDVFWVWFFWWWILCDEVSNWKAPLGHNLNTMGFEKARNSLGKAGNIWNGESLLLLLLLFWTKCWI